jgi:hypothetical protein
MGLIEKKGRKKSRANGAYESHGEAEAEGLAVEALVVLGVSRERKDLEEIRKGDRAKILISALLVKKRL